MIEQILLNHFAVFVLVLARVGALVAVAPILSSQGAPMRFRALLAVMLALLIAPLFAGSAPDGIENTPVLMMHILRESLLGLLLGFGVALLLSGIQLAGQAMSQMSGTALADVFDPNLNENATVFSQLLYFVTVAMFALLGGHRMLVGALLDTFAWLPPGQATLGDTYVDALATLITHSFLLGIRAAAPAMTALLLATIVLGLIGRTLPQINILAVGFSVNQVVLLGALAVSIGAVTWALPQHVDAAIDLVLGSVRDAVAVAPP